jgi:hypothetical protein
MHFALMVFPLLSLAAAPTPARQATAHVTVHRSFVSWKTPRGEINYEVVCEKDILVPVFDFRANPADRSGAEPAELLCDTHYRDKPVPISVRGSVELVHAEEFGLGLPKETELKRTNFVLDVAAGADFPYLSELQQLSGWQLFTEDLFSRSQIFTLSPEALIMIQCTGKKCKALGPQSVYRAEVTLVDAP